MAKNKNINIGTISGFAEYLPNQQIFLSKIKALICGFFEQRAFVPLDTSVIERTEVLFAKEDGETSKQVYLVKNKNSERDDEFGLRFDLTVPFARYVANNFSNISFPFRRYAVDKVYRGERAQKGRYREFYQADFDIVDNNLCDGEDIYFIHNYALNLMYEILSFLGGDLTKQEFTIRISDRKILNGVCEYLNISDDNKIEVLRIVDNIKKIPEEKIISMLLQVGLKTEQINKILSVVKLSGSNKDIIEQLKKSEYTSNQTFSDGVNNLDKLNCLRDFNCGFDDNKPNEKNISHLKIDLSITRGLDYYTGTVVETFFDDYPEFGSVLSGGRYDNLVADFANQKLEGFGLSLGLTRFFDLILEWEKSGLFDMKKLINNGAILIADISKKSDSAFFDIVEKFYEEKFNNFVKMNFKNFDQAYKYANNNHYKYMIINDSLAEENNYKIKNMITGESFIKNISGICEYLKSESKKSEN